MIGEPRPASGLRVAVVGVPRSGTSAAVGLLRILGWRLHQPFRPLCELGEHADLRGESGEHVSDLVGLPPGTVWKDPAVGAYADRVDWGWFDAVVRVTAPDPEEPLRSERRHGGVVDRERNAEWRARLYRSIPEGEPGAWLTLPDMREDPRGTLAHLAERLLNRYPLSSEVEAAQQFIRAETGYRCPLPGACFAAHGWR